MKKILFVTDLYYKANGRNYYEEDLYLTSKLREDFNLLICNPRDINKFNEDFDLIVFRNTGPAANFDNEYKVFREKIKTHNLLTYNSFDGHGDMNGKDYLIELTNKNLPVIKTIDNISNFNKLPDVKKYIIKPKDGADSIGLEFLCKEEIFNKVKKDDYNTLIQPFIDFQYEVSFYYIDDEFQYALYAPDKNRRWEMKEYDPTQEDFEFCKSILDWNNLSHGIQRIDACRNEEGQLLLVEHEDLNPYLSILDISPSLRDKFMGSLKKSLSNLLSL
ncbi:MAG: hypothetical protein RR942_16405 [Romboutsia sp.]